mgnify:CR=1 FL=1
MSLRSWRLAYENKAWLRRLCGLICEPSTQPPSWAWTSSRLATPASPSATPAKALEAAIVATYGPTSLGSLASRSPASCSSRTSEGMSAGGSILFSVSFDQWATELERDCLRRRKSARRTFARESSSTEYWPTPRNNTTGGPELMGGSKAARADGREASRDWPTPTRCASRTTHAVANPTKQRPSLSGQAQEQDWSAADSSSPPDQPTPTPGAGSSATAPTSLRLLNADFVDWLQGWPIGWTDLDSPATELSSYRRRMRSCLSWLVTSQRPGEKLSVQMS